MGNVAFLVSEQGQLWKDYAQLLADPSRNYEKAEQMARALIEAGVPYSEYESLHTMAVQNSHLAEKDYTAVSAIRSTILDCYDRAFTDYRKLANKYRFELTERRRESKIQSNTAHALTTSRDNLRTEVSMQQRVLAKHADELERLNSQLEIQRDEMAGFLYSVSHDLKSPMNTIKGLLELFLEENTDTDIDLCDVEHAIATATRTGVMLDDLLTFSTTLDETTDHERVDLDVLVADIFRDLSNVEDCLPHKFIKDRLPVVTGSAFQLRILFQNLISNGAKYCAKDRRSHVEVKCKGPRGLTHSAIAIIDNGIGIDPAYHEQIFGLFARLHGRNEYPGTGIGLSLCQRIVETHNGQIHVSSKPGDGSTFTVVLPL